MKRLVIGIGAVVLLGAAVGWSGPSAPRPELDFAREDRNPVTHLKLNNNPAEFQFAVVSDRTGGHRPQVFARAVEQINLLQPEFVVCVGDLIEGYTQERKEVLRQWREFQSYVTRLQMPFFYLPGNHDITNKVMGDIWKEKFGRSYFEFVYQNVLFLCLDTEDPPGKGKGSISAEQVAWVKKTLAANKSARWTLVFLHKPMWVLAPGEKNGWTEVEGLLAGRPYTVFAGHVHHYRKFVRHGQNYYMLATTGGDSRLRGVEYGEFDHIVWVTMKKTGPVLANILLDSVLREDLSKIAVEEEGAPEYFRRPTHPLDATVRLAGKPLAGAYVVLQGLEKGPGAPRADGFVESDGRVRLSTYGTYDGVPAGEYAVTVVLRKPFWTAEGALGPDALGDRYADPAKTPLRYKQRPGGGKLSVDLPAAGAPAKASNKETGK